MLKKRAIWIALLCATLVGAFVFPSLLPKAQGGTWCYKWDFANDGELGWTNVFPGQTILVAGSGWRDYGSGYDSVYIYSPVGSTASPITHIDVTSAIGPFGGGYPRTYVMTSDETVTLGYYDGGGWSYGFDLSGYSTNHIEFIADRLAGNTQYFGDDTRIATITLHGTGTGPWGDNCSASPTVTPTNTFTPTPTRTPFSAGGWTRPIASGYHAVDLLMAKAVPPFTELDQAAAQSVVIDYSENVGAAVHAIQPATVDTVTPLSGTCVNYILNNNVGPASSCGILDQYAAYLSAVGLPANVLQYLPFGITQVGVPIRWLFNTGAYLIKSTGTDDTQFWYVVANPKVKAGDVLAAGCWIGDTLSMSYTDLTTGMNYIPMSQGWTIVQARNDADAWLDIKPNLTQEPNGSLCSNLNTNCPLVNNPTFSNGASGWSLEADPTGMLPVAGYNGITPRGRIRSRSMHLSATTQYTIEVRYQEYQQPPPYAFKIQLGASPAIDIVNNAEYTPGDLVYRSTPATYTAGSDGLYELVLSAIEDGQNSQVNVSFVCISEGNGQAPAPAGGCIVLDPELNQTLDVSPWTGDTDPLVFGAAGMVIIPDGGWLKQSVTLHPKESTSQNYKLWVEWRRQGVVQTDHNISLDWVFGAHSGTFGPSTNQTWVTDSDTFTVAADTTADLTLTGDGSHTTEAAQINRVCITTADGGLPPGYDPPGPGGDIACRICTYAPVGDLATDFSDYVGWFGCRLTQLWECQFRTVLYLILYAITDILTFLGFMRIWLNATIVGGIAWTNGNMVVFTAWLNGQLTNLGITIQNSLISVRSFTLITGGGAGVWDAIVAVANAISSMVSQLINGIGTPIIALLQQIVTGLFGVAQGLISLIGTVLSIALAFLSSEARVLVSMLSGIIHALYSAFNHVAIAVPLGAPTCTTPGTLLYYPCLGFYILDNTIFSGPVVYIFPIFMGLVAWQNLLWAMRKVKGLFAA